MSTNTPTTENDHDTLKRLNVWLIVIGIFMLLYTAGLFMFIEHKAEEIQKDKTISIVAVDPVSGNIQTQYHNLFPSALLPKVTAPKVTAPTPVVETNASPQQMYTEKKSYELQEFVIIKYFHQAGVVLKKLPKDNYVILCRDHNRQLFTIEMPREMLIVPTAAKNMNPFALVND